MMVIEKSPLLEPPPITVDVQEAEKKKIKAKDFPDFWTKKYKARFGK